MGKYIAKRMLHLVGILIALSFLTFLLMYLAPGDAATKKLNAQGIAVSEEVLEKVRADMGLDRPFLAQYGDWALKVLRGDLGESYKDGMSVSGKIRKALGYTVQLALGSMLICLLISLPLAILTAIKKDSLADHVIRFFSFIANSLPNFLISVLLMYWLCVKARLTSAVQSPAALRAGTSCSATYCTTPRSRYSPLWDCKSVRFSAEAWSLKPSFDGPDSASLPWTRSPTAITR